MRVRKRRGGGMNKRGGDGGEGPADEGNSTDDSEGGGRRGRRMRGRGVQETGSEAPEAAAAGTEQARPAPRVPSPPPRQRVRSVREACAPAGGQGDLKGSGALAPARCPRRPTGLRRARRAGAAVAASGAAASGAAASAPDSVGASASHPIWRGARVTVEPWGGKRRHIVLLSRPGLLLTPLALPDGRKLEERVNDRPAFGDDLMKPLQ